jgi:hypothetical protein
MFMRIKTCLVAAALAGLAVASSIGCSESTNVPLTSAPAVQAPPPQPVPKDIKKGGGSGSSGNMNRNPGADS